MSVHWPPPDPLPRSAWPLKKIRPFLIEIPTILNSRHQLWKILKKISESIFETVFSFVSIMMAFWSRSLLYIGSDHILIRLSLNSNASKLPSSPFILQHVNFKKFENLNLFRGKLQLVFLHSSHTIRRNQYQILSRSAVCLLEGNFLFLFLFSFSEF